MERKIYESLLNWKNDKNKKPLMLLGVRQCGKTYILKEFCQKEYKKCAYYNLFENNVIREIYSSKLNSSEKFERLKLDIGYDIENSDVVIFIDEIQECEELIKDLKYINETHPNVNLVCAGSLLGVKLKALTTTFPVGKVEILNMYPMDFEEFLLAINKKMYIEEIKRCYKENIPMPDSMHETLLLYFNYYLYIGGMPENINEYTKNDFDILKMKNFLGGLIEDYRTDMKKYVESSIDTLRIRETYDSLPKQLANESKKFQYSKIKKGSRSKDYEFTIDWLINSNLVYKDNLVTIPEIPLEGFSDKNVFKIYLSDVGILNNLLGIKIKQLLNNEVSLYKGVIIENYVANTLVCNNYKLYYWKSNNTAEIDFLLNTNGGIIPLEVKAGDHTKAKSLDMFMKKYKSKYAIRLSTKNFGYNEEKRIKSVPLYAAFCIKE